MARVAISFLIVALASVASAQENPEYQGLIAEAVTEFDAHRFAEARVLFRRAHDIDPNARTLRGIGLASFELADYVGCHRALSGALRETRRALTDTQRAEVETLLARADRYLGIYEVALEPDGAELSVPRETDGTLVLPLGSHTIRASAEGFRTAEQTITVAGGERSELRFALDADGATRNAPRSSSGRDWTAPGVLLGIGGAAAIASIVIGVTWWPDRDAAIAECERHDTFTDLCVNPGEIEGQRDASIGVTIGVAAIGAAMLTAGIALAAGGGGEQQAAVRCAPAGAGLACHGTF